MYGYCKGSCNLVEHRAEHRGGVEQNAVLAGDPKSLVYYVISKLKQEAHLAGDPKRKG